MGYKRKINQYRSKVVELIDEIDKDFEESTIIQGEMKVCMLLRERLLKAMDIGSKL
jgi:hypothetical protein